MPPQTETQRTAADIMTPAPRTCSTFSTVLEAVMIFRDADCGAVPVLADGQPVGLVTDRDVALALAEFEDRLPTTPVGEIMSKGTVSVSVDTPMHEIVERFGERSVRRLLVVDANQHLVGIIGWADVAPEVSNREIGHAVADVVQD